MGTNVHCGKYPKEHKGELRLAKRIVALDDNDLHLWFALEEIPGVPDIDILLWHRQAGMFVIEVKAVPIHMLKECGHSACKIEGRKRGKSPQRQAYDGLQGLYDKLSLQLKLPFMVATVWWPLFSRTEWREHWDNEDIRDLANSMLFEEDLEAGSEALRKRLEYIYKAPPIRGGSKWEFRPDISLLAKLDKHLDPHAKPKTAESDLQRLQIIEADIGRKRTKEIKLGESRLLLYTGKPGTGKTFGLLQQGFSWALNENPVLFCCFNKVLAADIRRMTMISTVRKHLHENLEIRDIFQLTSLYQREFCGEEISPSDPSYDDWGREIVGELKKGKVSIPLYDLVLVDEAQDMKQWYFELLELHRSDSGTLVVAAGEGQDLYGSPSDWIKNFLKRTKGKGHKKLKRVFRNDESGFKLAQTFYKSKLIKENIRQSIADFSSAKEKREFIILRPKGKTHSLVNLDLSALRNIPISASFYQETQSEVMIREYKEIIDNELEMLKNEDQSPMDLLVLVPSENSMERDWALEAIKKATDAKENGFIDLTDGSNRRCIPTTDMVRLCTFHSSRGIEGLRVVIFGLEQLERICRSGRKNQSPEETREMMRRLGYVILSRALLHCTIVMNPDVSSKTGDFIQVLFKEVYKSEQQP